MQLKKAWPYALVLLPWFTYMAITILAPRSRTVSLFGLTDAQLFYARLGVLAAYMVNWLAGCHGAVTSFSTAAEVPEKKRAFMRFGLGITSLLTASIFGSVLSACRSLFPGDLPAIRILTILFNYFYVIPPLIGAYFLFAGTGSLTAGGSRSDIWIGWKAFGWFALACLSGAYVWLVFGKPNVQSQYFLPDAAIALTLVAPYLAAFTLTLLSVFRGARYFLDGQGRAFEVASKRFISGLLAVILGAFILQAYVSLGPTRTAAIGIIASLSLVYISMLFQMFGYLLLASGIHRISAIERLRHQYDTPGDKDEAMPPPSPLPDFNPFGTKGQD